MRRGRIIGTSLVLIAALLPIAPGAGPAAAASTRTVVEHGITFDHANVVDPFRLISEPDLAIDSKGNVYTSGPGGSASQQSTFWKSEDNGIQYHPIGLAGDVKQNSAAGGGDTEFAIAKDDTIYAADQEFLLCNAVFRSTDGANTFTTGETCLPGTDRPWMSVYDPTGTPQGRRIYFAANQGALLTAASLGCYVNVSTDNGLTYTGTNGTTGLIPGNQHCVGHMAIDPTNGDLYVPTSNGIWKSTDGGRTFTNLGNPTGPIATTLFANLATDSAGNLYYAYTRTRSGSDGPVMLAMIPKGSTTWSTPVQVNTPDLKANVFPWIVAGDPGRIAIMYLGTTDTGFNSSGPGIGGPNAQWHVYTTFSTDAINCTTSCTVNPSPTFQQVQTDDHVMHKGTICIGGFPGCLEGNADRSMADFFVVAMNPQDGRVFVVWDDNADKDTTNNIGKSIVTIARERTGPSLLADQDYLMPVNLRGDLSITKADSSSGSVTLTGTQGLPPGNYSTDPAGDAVYPQVPVKGANIPALDITEASVGESGADYKFTMKVGDLSQQAIAQASQGGGTPSWMFTWWDKGPTSATDQHYYVKWRGTPGTAEFGQIGDVLYPALGAPAPKFLTYVPSGTATAAVDGNKLTITVPKASVGAPANGDHIDNVTAYGLDERGPIPTVIDATKAFSYIVGTPAAQQHGYDGYVQVSVDDPNFGTPINVPVTSDTWTATIPTTSLAPGSHTLYARQVLSSELYNPTLPDVQAGPVATSDFTITPPAASIADGNVVEGNSGTSNATFTVSLDKAAAVDVTVPYTVAPGTAVTPDDFAAGSGSVTIPAGQTSGTISVAVNGDTEPEPNETFSVTLGTPTNATIADGQAQGTIVDDDAMPTCTITGTEGNDVLQGTPGDDIICGLGGNDSLIGSGGNDILIGGAGNDQLNGGGGVDTLRGQEGDDYMDGGIGNDTIVGFTGGDTLIGYDGADTLNAQDGVNGNDSVDGGGGTDTCTVDPLDKITGCP